MNKSGISSTKSHTYVLTGNARRDSRQLITTRVLWKHCGDYIVLFTQGEAQNTQDHLREVIGLCSRRIVRHFFPGTSKLLMLERIARD